MEQASAEPEDVYRLELAPDEFDELLGSYENFVEWCRDEMDERTRKLAERVLAKLRAADVLHVGVDEMDQ